MSFVDDLKNLEVGVVLDDETTLADYSVDASIFEVKPRAVIQPRSVGDLERLVKFVSERRRGGEDLSLSPRAAGTCMSGGSLTDSLMVDLMPHFNQLGPVVGETITAGPGVFYRDLEKATLAQGLLMPAYTASKDLCAVGGMVGNNAAGERTLRYGSTARYVKSLKVVLADGKEHDIKPLHRNELEMLQKQDNFFARIVTGLWDLIEKNNLLLKRTKPQVSKNSAGYLIWDLWDGQVLDLPKLFVGSQGTIGIITEIVFSLVPRPAAERVLVITLDNLKVLPAVVSAILAHQPDCFESYDRHTYDLAKRFLAETARAAAASGGAALSLLAQFSGPTTDEALRRVERAAYSLQALHLPGVSGEIVSPEAANAFWQIRRASFRLLCEHAGGQLRPAPFIDDIIVPPPRLPEFLPKLEAILSRYQLTYTLAGHIGDGNFHLIPLVDLTNPQQRAWIPELAEDVFKLVVGVGGGLAGEHNDGLVRTSFLPLMYPPAILDLFAAIENLFDPLNVFNPKKKTGDNRSFALEHLSHSNRNKFFH